MEEVQWGPAFAFLAAGLAIGTALLWRLGRRPPGAAPAAQARELDRSDLQTRFEAQIAQLRELEDTGGKRSVEQLAAERRELELAAARTLLALEALASSPASVAAAPPEDAPTAVSAAAAPAPALATSSARAGFFWGLGSAAALGLLFYFVFQAAEQRSPGGSVTGSLPTMGVPSAVAGAPASEATGDAELDGLVAFVAQNPDDLEARLELARRQLLRQDMMAVFNETQAVLARDADNPRALSYQSLVRLAMGQADRAEEMLERALRRDPQLFDGYVHLMLVHTSLGDTQGAEVAFERAVARFPERADALRRLLAEMRAVEPTAAPAGPEGVDPHAGVDTVAGVLELDPAARAALAPNAVVFITLRPAGVVGGAPLAARRLAAAAFPLAFSIGQGDSMTGAPIPESVALEARLDADGDLSTRPPSDPFVRVDGLRLGSRDLRLLLRPRDEG